MAAWRFFEAIAVAVQAGVGIKPSLKMTDDLNTQRRKLAWRASRRGIKEMDLLVGGFAAARLPRMDAAELGAFERLLDIPDQQLLAWATGQEPVPPANESAMLRALLSFRPDAPK